MNDVIELIRVFFVAKTQMARYPQSLIKSAIDDLLTPQFPEQTQTLNCKNKLGSLIKLLSVSFIFRRSSNDLKRRVLNGF